MFYFSYHLAVFALEQGAHRVFPVPKDFLQVTEAVVKSTLTLRMHLKETSIMITNSCTDVTS